MTTPRTTAQILAAPLTLDVLRAVAHHQVTPTPDGYLMHGVTVTQLVRRLAADELVDLPDGRPPLLTARGEDLAAIA